MAITDIQISDTLETGAPSIKYEGNEGPQDPRQEQMVAQLKEEYMKYVFEMQEQGLEPMSFQQFIEQVMAEGQMSSAQPMPNRQMAAYGGIMDLNSGRRAYGLGSVFKKITRPIKKFAKSDLGKAALTAAAVYGLGGGFGGPGNWGLNKGFSFGKMIPNLKSMAVGKPASWTKPASTHAVDIMRGGTNYIPGTKGIIGAAGELSPLKALGYASALPLAGVGMGEQESLDLGLNIPDSQKFDVDFSQMRKDIGDAVTSGVKENFDEVLTKYGLIEGVNINRWEDIRTGSAEGGRAEFYEGGLSIPSENTMEDARKTAMQDRLGGITEIMKQADLYRQGDVGQMYMAEGGLMDLGGMEKDYRNDGGFVPIGGKEKADDVPARLSKNEFVFTADAVRGAGGGDIDKGAEIMENVMKKLENSGRISEESQGLKGAQEMFDVSERLSEVV